jgi:hypothetical protein
MDAIKFISAIKSVVALSNNKVASEKEPIEAPKPEANQ